MASAHQPSSTARSTRSASGHMWSRSWCRHYGPAMCISPYTNSRRSAPHRSGRRAPPLSAALQSRFQSDRTDTRQTESVPPRRATTNVRSGISACRRGARALHAGRMPELHPALRLPPRCTAMKTALAWPPESYAQSQSHLCSTNPCAPEASLYIPTISPRGLIPRSTVSVEAGTLIVS
jgi:hypothetical protein